MEQLDDQEEAFSPSPVLIPLDDIKDLLKK